MGAPTGKTNQASRSSRSGRSSRLRVVAFALLTASLIATACGDGSPAFCTPLGKVADLSQIAAALKTGDMKGASAQAAQLRKLSGEAPPEIRADFVAVADAIVEIVDLVAKEPVEGQSDPGQFEQRREDLNNRLGQIDTRTQRITVWASEQCGLEL